MSKALDLTGQRFNRLTVISRAENSKDGKSRWLCRCDCGNFVTVNGIHLSSGHTKSCGCYNRETARERPKTHGMSGSTIYNTWLGIKDRCLNSSDTL